MITLPTIFHRASNYQPKDRASTEHVPRPFLLHVALEVLLAIMAAPYYADDAAASARHGYATDYASADHEYGAHQAAQARQYASGALPPPNLYDPILNASSSTFDRHRHRHRHRRHNRPATNRQPSDPPPHTRQHSRRERDRSLSPSSRDDNSGAEDPVRKAQSLIKGTFSNSTSGLGVGILGAIVGGLVAREASDSTNQGKGHRNRRQSYSDQERKRLFSTVLGAAVGGFGANAIEKRIEKTRDKIADQEESWDKKSQRTSRRRSMGDDLEETRARRQSQRRSRDAYDR